MDPELIEKDEATIDDTIRDTLREITEREGLNDEPAPKAAVEVEAPAAVTERTRDEAGKFAKKESATPASNFAAEPSKEGSEAQAAADTEQPLVTTTGQPIDLNRAPSSWKPAAKAAWAALPEAVRQDIHRRESDFLNGNKGFKENADFGQQVRQKFEPYKAIMAAEGATPEAAIDDYLKTSAVLRLGSPQQKLQAVFDLDKRFNTGLGDYFRQQVAAEVARQSGGEPATHPQQQPQAYNDPRVDGLVASFQAQESERLAQDEAVRNAATERFISAKDDKGLPLYPFWENVAGDMSARAKAIRWENPSLGHDDVLKQAYDAAVWANPETRAVLISQQQAPAITQEANLRKVEAAKRASGLNMPKRGALPAGEALGSMDDTIRDTWRQLTTT